MKFPYISLLAVAFVAACSDDDSDNFLVRGDTASYSSEEEYFSSSTTQKSSDSETSVSSSTESSSSLSSSEESSSSELSSSSVRSSSSLFLLDTIPYVPPCRYDYEDNCGYGTLVDDRDGQSYRTVDIGEQTWMAENLKYVSENSLCYDSTLEYCDVYGRLYPWAEAMEVCPTGWHLPSLDEWKILYAYAGGIYTSASKLRATSGWECLGCEGTDHYGFSVLPAGGYRDDFGKFKSLRLIAIFWTSTDYDSNEDRVYNICFDERDEIIDGNGPKAENKFSVRCIQDK